MSMYNRLAALFSRYSFDHHADQALALLQPSAPAAPELPIGSAADTPPLRLIPPVNGGTAGRARTDSPGAAGHPNQWPIDWDIVREGLAHLRAVMADGIAWIDEIDPTPAGLAQAAPDART